MNKFRFIATGQIENLLEQLTEEVKKNISRYLGVDIDNFLELTDAVIFGGAVRDSIAELPINDIDIMALTKSAETLYTRLESYNFRLIPATKIDTVGLYTNIHCIHEPKTFMKIEEFNSISRKGLVQIIKPCVDKNMTPMEKLMWNLHQVDLSCCGVAYSVKAKTIFETYPGAIEHCKNKQFIVLKDNIMHQKDRILKRMTNLKDRGWKEIYTNEDNRKEKP
jgi:hypothetical protein